MSKSRLEAFSDGVLAIIITIMVLELRPPHGAGWREIRPLIPVLVSYMLSFIIIGIYWGNHHHLLHTVGNITSGLIWANLHLLFWLSLIPFATAWMQDTEFDSVPVAVYAGLLNLCGLAYYVLLLVIRRNHPNHAALEGPLRAQTRKGVRSVVLYTLAIPAAFVHPLLSGACFLAVAILWWIPDRNIERSLREGRE